MKIEAGKPRIIRQYVKPTKAKSARDKRTEFRLRLIKGRSQHTCAGPCPWPDRVIEVGPYIMATHPDWSKRIGANHFQEERKYHPDCVPWQARPLVRFLIPTPWVMTLVVGNLPSKTWRFTSVEAWRAAMDHHYPEMAKRWSQTFQGGKIHQVGINDHWSTLEYKPRPFEQ